MKWLILFIFFSCGKHQEPSAIDFRDNDGDLSINSEDAQKEFANFKALGAVRGILRIDSDVMLEIPFSNDNKIERKTIELLIKNERDIKLDEYFTEWSKINFEKMDLAQFKVMKQYPITLSFDSSSDQADEIALVDGKTVKILAPWKSIVRINIAHEELKSLMEGRIYLSLRKKFEKSKFSEESQELSIRNKTNRIYFYNGKNFEIFYGDKELNLKNILDILKISNHTPINDDDLFFNSDRDQEGQWFTREISTGEKIIVFSNPKDLKEEFTKKYNYKKMAVKRENGAVVSNLQLNNLPQSNVYFRIKKIVKSLRSFSESSYVQRHGTGGGPNRDADIYDCTHFLRNISSEIFSEPSLNDLFENLQILSDKKIVSVDILRNAEIREQQTLQGIYWEIKLNDIHQNLEITLKPKDNSSYVMTGEYHNSCGNNANRGRGPKYLTNPEGIYSFEVESLVEKIDL